MIRNISGRFSGWLHQHESHTDIYDYQKTGHTHSYAPTNEFSGVMQPRDTWASCTSGEFCLSTSWVKRVRAIFVVVASL